MSAPVLPTSLVDNPRLDRWIRFQPDRTVRIATGKVEIGQGVVTALGQIAADELDVPLDRVAVLSGDTDQGPDEMYTTSSLVDRDVGRLGAAGLRRGARQGARPRGAPAELQPRRLTVVDGAVPAERRSDRPGLLDRRRRDRSRPGRSPARRRRSRPMPTSVVGHSGAAARPAGEAERRGLRARRAAGRTCCMPARCASPTAAPRWRRSTRPRSGAPPRASCRSCARPTSWPSSARSRAWRRRAAAAAPAHARGTTLRAAHAGAAGSRVARRASRATTGASARRLPRDQPSEPRADHASRGPISRMPRWGRPARWPSSATAI